MYSILSLLLCVSFFFSDSLQAVAWDTAGTYFDHSSHNRVNTDAVIYRHLSENHRGSRVSIVSAYDCDFIAFAASGAATATPILKDDEPLDHYVWRSYFPPSLRLDGDNGTLSDRVFFAVYSYHWKGKDFLLYIVDGRDGLASYPTVLNQYLISDPHADVDALIFAAGFYNFSLHDEIWVYDQGYWQKDQSLYRAIQTSFWDDVILDSDMKTSIQNDVSRFFASREQYAKYKVPWKRGLIFHGPPGNGKTVSIKAIMHTLYNMSTPVPTLYVKTLASWAGPESALKEIFDKARAEAPCLLVFEDLDSLIVPGVRSYFLNQVDGLQLNQGILMIGSTNHLDLLDPGIAKRPSRFDRKYLFPDPNREQRQMYCAYWRAKLADNTDIEYPEKLVGAIANITEGFSFAYIQEAFVASLLQIAREVEDEEEVMGGKKDKDLDGYRLWRVMKKQVRILREEMDAERAERVEMMEMERERISSAFSTEIARRRGRALEMASVPFGKYGPQRPIQV